MAPSEAGMSDWPPPPRRDEAAFEHLGRARPEWVYWLLALSFPAAAVVGIMIVDTGLVW